MPSTILKSLANKSGKALKTVEDYWDKAKKSVAKMKDQPDDKYAYMVGIVKNRLGLESTDLVLAGMPVELVAGSALVEATLDDLPFDKVLYVSDKKTLQAKALNELVKVELGEPSDIAMKDEQGNVFIKRSFMSEVERPGSPYINKSGEKDVFDYHQLKIAKQTLRYSDVGARIMGGMTKEEAREVLRKHGINPDRYE